MITYNYNTFPFKEIISNIPINENCVKNYSLKHHLFYITNNKVLYKILYNEYKVQFSRNRLSDKKSLVIICGKDAKKLMHHCLYRIKMNNINNDHDILIIDDRSTSSDLLELSDKYQVSYLRIDNTLDIFNYSILNNIGSTVASYFDKELIIFYNNDLWPSTKNSLPNIIDKHFKYNSDITGCKLIYPSKKDYSNIGKINHVLGKNLEKAYSTIQHGGIFFDYVRSMSNNQKPSLKPGHLWRFYSNDHFLASKDSPCYAVTGALQVVNTQSFLNIGGFNGDMASAFQDIDLCIKALKHKMSIYYIGSESMLHAESITNHSEQQKDNRFLISDNILWELLWNNKIHSLLGFHLG